ncbi:hypothetical protein ACHAW6_006782 [Cyclotella cf. meneghiniana]
MTSPTAIELLEDLISDLEAKLNLAPGADPPVLNRDNHRQPADGVNSKKDKKKQPKPSTKKEAPSAAEDIPDICKLEFKVGLITKVWVHPEADKLYCEEIDVGEEGGPRQIASGLRMHYSEEEMLGKRVLVVSNLKPKNLVGFKSHGMVLCAAETKEDGSEKVEFIEPPEGAPLGEVITFDGLPPPSPVAPAQVEKKKVFAACMEGMKTNEDCVGTWNGHVFMTSAGPCRGRSVRGGPMR